MEIKLIFSITISFQCSSEKQQIKVIKKVTQNKCILKGFDDSTF
jgi:hypothetical protein